MENNKLLEMLIQASWQASVGLAILLGLRLVAGDYFAGRWLHLLWALLALRLLLPDIVLPEAPPALPATPSLPLAAYMTTEPLLPQVAGRLETVTHRENTRITETKDILRIPPAPFDWWGAATMAWLSGAAILGGYFIVGSLWLSGNIKRRLTETPADIARAWADCCSRYSPRRRPLLVTSHAVNSPVLLGLFRPRLVLPAQGLGALSPADWEHIFLHELAHYQRRDTWTNALHLTALSVHWFNPLLWLCQRPIRADRELAADERALHLLGADRRADYGETLLRVLSQTRPSRALPAAIGLMEGNSGLKRRLRHILNFRPASLVLTALGLVLLSALAVVIFAQETKPAPEKIPAEVQEKSPQARIQELQDKMLAAARDGNAEALRKAQSGLPEFVYIDDQRGAAMLTTLISERNLPAFVMLLKELRQSHAAVNWQPTVAELKDLLADNRKDFIDALLIQKLKLDLLTNANAQTTSSITGWVTERINQVHQQRADEDALVRAAGEGDLATIKRLLDASVDINCEVAEAFTPLTRAAVSGQAAAVRLLLQRGAAVDKPKYAGWDYTPLCLASTVEVAQILKDAGADVNAKLYRRDVPIVSYPIRWASTDVVKWFADQGVDLARGNDDSPSLLYNAGNPGTAELILSKGVDTRSVDKFGRTALIGILDYHADSPAEIVKVLLKYGADPNAPDSNGNPPLMYAPDAASVKVLVAGGANIRALNNGNSVLKFIGGTAKEDREPELLRLGAIPTKPGDAQMLKDTLLNNDIRMAKTLLLRGADPDARLPGYRQYEEESPLAMAIASGKMEIANEMRKAGGRDVGLLSQAAAEGNISLMQKLIKDGANVTESTQMGTTPLFFAVCQGQMEAVKLLLENGADPDVTNIDGWSPLALANFRKDRVQDTSEQRISPIDRLSFEDAASFFTNVIPLLTAYASTKETTDAKGETPLTKAAAQGNALIVRYLAKKGANVNHQRPDGMTPLMIAITTKPHKARLDMMTETDPTTGERHYFSLAAAFVKDLLTSGADSTIRNREGKTALDLARERGDAEITAILENLPKPL